MNFQGCEKVHEKYIIVPIRILFMDEDYGLFIDQWWTFFFYTGCLACRLAGWKSWNQCEINLKMHYNFTLDSAWTCFSSWNKGEWSYSFVYHDQFENNVRLQPSCKNIHVYQPVVIKTKISINQWLINVIFLF